jgi:lon-related putative ATP-dependent protease
MPPPNLPLMTMPKKSLVPPLEIERLYRSADLAGLSFTTTADIEPIDGLIGQRRAMDAVRFGTQIEKSGFNLFVIGPPAARMRQSIEAVLKETVKDWQPPPDWVYVNNFKEPHKPTAIDLPPGRAPDFHNAMHELIDDLKAALPAVFDSEDYHTRRGAIDEVYQKKQADEFTHLRDKAAAKRILILRTPLGFALAPGQDGEVVPPEEFNSWPEAKRREVEQTIETLEKDLEQIVRHIPQWERERRDEIRRLNRETAQVAVEQLIEETKSRFSDLPRITSHLQSVQNDLVENVDIFTMRGDEGAGQANEALPGGALDRYEVNVLVTHADLSDAAPIIEELHPTLSNLMGRIEHVSRQGVLITNFRLIKAGAMHRANGGFLLLDARNVLMEPFSWSALKRALRRKKIVIEDIARLFGFASTVSLEPDPIPLKMKVILFGDPLLYFLLAAFDPELAENFKVLADFEDDVARSPESEFTQARVITSILAREGMKPMERAGVGLVIEHCARLAGHAEKLTLLVEEVRDLLAEADHWAADADRGTIAAADVQNAIDQRIDRNARLRDRVRESILREITLVATSGEHVGQINGLSVIELGGFSFGRPARITCRVRPGSGKVVDIEREVELGGPTHSKGVLILSGFLAGRYALDTPMSLLASLVFEQSYAGVEGDSASCAELLALLSSLAEIPLRQDLSVTGSVNQHGDVQAIGGVNEKIEGFFDICNERGLTGTQGVVIPKGNIQHLMLRRDVIDACAAGRFAVYAIGTIDEGIELLTRLAPGERDGDGKYPDRTVNGLVEARLRAFASVRRRFSRTDGVPSEGEKA